MTENATNSQEEEPGPQSEGALFSGIVTVSVKDLSSGGFSSTFEINISVLEGTSGDDQEGEED